MDNALNKLMRVFDIGISHGVVLTGSAEELLAFREKLIGKLNEESVKVIPLDLSGSWLSDVTCIEEPDTKDMVLVWGLEYLSPQENRTYSLRTTLDRMKHGGPQFAIFCENACYSAHFNDYSAPFYHFCLRMPVGCSRG